jgi:hypothetical protein
MLKTAAKPLLERLHRYKLTLGNHSNKLKEEKKSLKMGNLLVGLMYLG